MKTNKSIFCISILLSLVVILGFSPITQPQDYHNFAEQRNILNIAHFGDVVSNLSFIIVGILLLGKIPKWDAFELYKDQVLLFKGLAYSCIALGFGSGYYHLNPTNPTLAWDRATMVLGFAVIFYDSCVRYDIFCKRNAFPNALITTALFLGTVVFWVVFDRLEPYVFVQFFTMFVLVVLAVKNYKEIPSGHLFNMFFWYALAKVFENQDKVIFALTRETISGHTLKHIAYAIALYVFGKDMLRRAKKLN